MKRIDFRFYMCSFFFLFHSFASPAQFHFSDFTKVQEEPPPSSVFYFTPSLNQKLIYMAVRHTNDMKSSVATTIKNLLEKENVDFCILEGFEESEGISPQRVVSKAENQVAKGICGENLYAAHLCHSLRIHFIGGEKGEKFYLQQLEKYGIVEEDLVFYLLAQQIPWWHRDGTFEKENLKVQFETFMKEDISTWLEVEPVKYTYEDFIGWHEKHMGCSYDPEKNFLWDSKQEELLPYLGPGATRYQKIAAYIMYIRDEHVVDVIQRAISNHSTVLVIYGAYHYKWQKKTLLDLFGAPVKTFLIK
ncbi:MAG: hypothetical protein HKM07_05915 [Chlamydiae bacterium]|nr:hypothetical protein [Chlamydiota bacterium]